MDARSRARCGLYATFGEGLDARPSAGPSTATIPPISRRCFRRLVECSTRIAPVVSFLTARKIVRLAHSYATIAKAGGWPNEPLVNSGSATL